MTPLLAQLRARAGEAWDPAHAAGTRSHLFLVLCAVTTIAFFVWAAFAHLDVVSTAMGEVVPASQVKSVQHLEGGIVAGILVGEGEAMKEGQPLLELETTRSGAEAEELGLRLVALRSDIARLEAEVSGRDAPTFPPELRRDNPDLVKKASELFNVRRNRLNFELESQRNAMTQREREIEEVKARISNNQQTLRLLDEQIRISEQLLQRDLTNRMVHLNLLKEAAVLRGRIAEDNAALPRVEAALAEARAQMDAVRTRFQEEASTDLDEATRSFEELSQRLRKFDDSLRRSVLRAPVDGIIKSIYVFTKGGVVQPGATVMDIVPADDRLVVEAKLPPQDIGYVRRGQTATVRLASADAPRFGHLNGQVVRVSPDTLVTEKDVAYYKVRIETEGDHFQKRDLRYDLFPGMQVICAIETGQRTVLEYLLDPLIGAADRAMQER
ncbi:MAG: HlyD family type I secretion periplasmic adaptor subunit [Alphaproteobacteria bacterium]